MLDFILSFVTSLVFYVIITTCIRIYLKRQEAIKQEAVDYVKDNLIRIETVLVDNKPTWLVYSYNDDLFLAQGDSQDEAIENLKRRFPERDFYKLNYE